MECYGRMLTKENRHSLGPLDLWRCAKQNNNYEKYARYAKQAREGIIRKSVAQVVKKMKLYEVVKKDNGI